MLFLFCPCCEEEQSTYQAIPPQQQARRAREARRGRATQPPNSVWQQIGDTINTPLQSAEIPAAKEGEVWLNSANENYQQLEKREDEVDDENVAVIEMPADRYMKLQSGEKDVQPVSAATKECVICMDEFTEKNPEVPVLCDCGVNKTHFHYHCLLEWMQHRNFCPVCRGSIFFQEPER
uniref:RING-type domain-containing protein n=1 Tax=Pinguiococcus pyrenoidosus TaxID=172671 RepID=A0A6U0WDD7_9STRA|mmetsp:Transcript_742/g.3008  ORF Transcript_742/g.3008 Transcript_742/m.3008 type:complete len:179 (+) Transcript_742:392-928(+)